MQQEAHVLADRVVEDEAVDGVVVGRERLAKGHSEGAEHSSLATELEEPATKSCCDVARSAVKCLQEVEAARHGVQGNEGCHHGQIGEHHHHTQEQLQANQPN